MLFRDRADAGRHLAERLRDQQGRASVVLGLPRGGVVVAAEVARVLDAPLDVIVVRKLGVPFQPELAMGAVGEGGALVVNERVAGRLRLTEIEFAEVERRERAQVEDRALRFRGDRPRLMLAGRTALVVDDGIATGSTARAACQVARAQGATRVVLAVPVCSPDAVAALRGEVDELVYLEAPRRFHAVGQSYDDFRPTPDHEVAALLQQAARRRPTAAATGGRSTSDRAGDPAVDEADATVGRAPLGVPERARPPDPERPVQDSTRMRKTPS